MKIPCAEHPDRRAHASCRHCAKAACRRCEVRMRGEVYCSTRCAREAARHPLWRRFRGPLSRPVSPWIAIAAVALAGVGPVILALHTVSELDRLQTAGPFPKLHRASGGARIDEVVETADGTRLGGRAENGQAVFLYAAGRPVASAFVEDGRFRFDGVREKGPYGVRSMPIEGGARRLAASRPPAAAPRIEVAEAAPAPPVRPAAPAPAADADASKPKPAAAPANARPATAPPPIAARTAAPVIAAALVAPSPRPRPARPAATPTPETRLSIHFSSPRAEPTAPPASHAAPPIPGSPAPPVSAAEGIPPDLTRGPADRPEILVSFDAGSSDRGASQILDALSSRGIHTTVFLTGEFIRRYPALVRRIARDGHEVGNHTDTHPHLTTFAKDGRQVTRAGVDRAFIAGELARTARLYHDTTGLTMAPLWRAPFGEHNPQIRRWAAEQGYWHVGWTGGRGGLDGLDWISDPGARGYQSAEALLKRLVRHAENGGIVLLHLGSDRRDPVAERIDILLDGLKARRFELVRASDFLSREGWNAERLASFRAPAAAR